MSTVYYGPSYYVPPPLHDDHGRILKPSERFARNRAESLAEAAASSASHDSLPQVNASSFTYTFKPSYDTGSPGTGQADPLTPIESPSDRSDTCETASPATPTDADGAAIALAAGVHHSPSIYYDVTGFGETVGFHGPADHSPALPPKNGSRSSPLQRPAGIAGAPLPLNEQATSSIVQEDSTLPPPPKSPKRKSFFTFKKASQSSEAVKTKNDKKSTKATKKKQDDDAAPGSSSPPPAAVVTVGPFKNVEEIATAAGIVGNVSAQDMPASTAADDHRGHIAGDRMARDYLPRSSNDAKPVLPPGQDTPGALPARTLIALPELSVAPTFKESSMKEAREKPADISPGRRSFGRNFMPSSLGRKSKQASNASARPPLPDFDSNTSPTWQKSPYENDTGKAQQAEANGMVSALDEGWTILQPGAAQVQESTSHDLATGESKQDSLPAVPPKPSTYTSPSKSLQHVFKTGRSPPKTPSPAGARLNKALPKFKHAQDTGSQAQQQKDRHDLPTPPSTFSPASENVPNRENVKSPPFFLKSARKSSKGLSSPPPLSSNQMPLTPPSSPPQHGEGDTKPAIAAWPAASHVFGAAAQALGKATIGPQVAIFRDSPTHPSAACKRAVSPISGNDRQVQVNGSSQRATATPSENADFLVGAAAMLDDVFAPVQDPRKVVYDMLAIPQTRKSSVYTASSGASTPLSVPPVPPLPLQKGKPRLVEAILKHPKTILANILDYLSYRSFKRLSYASSTLYRATLPFNDASVLAEVVKQRYLASYGYRPLPSHVKYGPGFTLADLHMFYIGVEFALSEYAIFASEHKRKPLKSHTTKMFRESTRAYNRLVFRLPLQSRLSNAHEQQQRLEFLLPKLVHPYWQDYRKADQVQVFKVGRCASLRVWVPCASQWMTNEEIVEVEREIHRSRTWRLLKRGDLVRNIALGDIANEGILIFDGKYLRDLSYAYDSVGCLPSWVNAFLFSPSYFHNQVASATAEPIVHLDLAPFHQAVQANLLLCKEKVDLTSPSGEQYKVTRYVYRTVVDLTAGTVFGDVPVADNNKAQALPEQLHLDWVGQLIIETDGTTEAAKALLQRASPVTRGIGQDQSNLPSHSHNHPYRILRNLSRPGMIFCKVVENSQLP